MYTHARVLFLKVFAARALKTFDTPLPPPSSRNTRHRSPRHRQQTVRVVLAYIYTTRTSSESSAAVSHIIPYVNQQLNGGGRSVAFQFSRNDDDVPFPVTTSCTSTHTS
ncbi:Uncharacterized protein FWK35_00006222 [Aphis craccivora]|uniref:Uncharacterized protein n=1 Tax=Aphis craccivora TaxID=307492 RepID=A0A6G0ZQF8_APHCR|nr:Uncharacterized protein FWK35_00006222 [Aphis craccivora]